MLTSQPSSVPRRLKFIGCEIIYREACLLAAQSPRAIDVEFLRKGLHDLPTVDMQARIQSAVDAVDPAEYEAVLLGYARCNDGLVGVRAGQVPLVIPKAHDCITFFFGSRGAYRAYFDQHPGTYYMTTGWCERNAFGEGQYSRPAYGQQGVMDKLGLGETYEQMVAKYGKENADFIRETIGDWRQHYRDMLYLRMNVCDEESLVQRAREEAATHNWRFAVQDGDWTLLRKLFGGVWDDDFAIVQPGQQIVARNDADVLAAE